MDIDFTQLVDSHSSERHAIYNPVDESLITDQVQYAVEEDVDAAVEAALAAFQRSLEEIHRRSAWSSSAQAGRPDTGI